jgi:hypothetical protein
MFDAFLMRTVNRHRAIGASGHPTIGVSGHPTIWASDHLIILR